MEFNFESELWEYNGQGAWHFISLPKDTFAVINDVAGDAKRGFGSVRVEVTIGNSTWNTSIFPDSKRGTVVLPVKKAVRTAEKIEAGDTASLTLRVLEA